MDGRNHNNIRYAGDTVYCQKQEESYKVVKELEKKGRTTNCKKTEYMVFIKKNRPTCKLKMEHVIDQTSTEVKYLKCVLTENEKCDGEIPTHIGIADAFQKLNQVLRNRKKIVINKERNDELLCYIGLPIWQ